MIDSGASINLISPATMKCFQLEPRPIHEPPWNLRVANDHLVPITECIDIIVNIAGMEIPITAYITGIGVVYNLLLFRRWIEAAKSEKKAYEWHFTTQGPNSEKLLVLPTLEEDLKEVEVEAE
jgi:hypothetical protein